MLKVAQKKSLAQPKTSWLLSLLAIIIGFIAAWLIMAFNYAIEIIQLQYLDDVDNYISLAALSRFQLPIYGGLAILFLSWLTGHQYARTGIPFVLYRLKTAHGIIPLRNTLNQFFGSTIALASGFSVGREGPAVHLGAACSSYIGQKLQLPYNSQRTLCACGIAAGISASFNTPIAAVIFVMEVILREYKVNIFFPIMLSAIVGTTVTHSFHGFTHEFDFFNTISISSSHYPALVMLGLFLGLLAFLYNRYLVLLIKRTAKYHIFPRILCAGFITGIFAYFAPFAMANITVIDFSLTNQWQLQLLIGLLLTKFVMTICALGLGVPGGTIGPILSIGAIAGTCASSIFVYFAPSENLASDFALMGMAGFMAATLNAPLAALLAVVELSNQIEIVVPAMIVIASSCLSSGQLFNNGALFAMQLDAQGLTFRKTPIEESLQKIGVLSLLKDKFSILHEIDQKDYPSLLKNKAEDELIVTEKKINEQKRYVWVTYQLKENVVITENSLPVEYLLLPLSSQSTLAEVYHALVKQREGGVYIYGETIDDILGIVTFEQIRLYLLTGKLH